MRKVNPYTPGAGSMPAHLAGRDRLIENAQNSIDNIVNRYPQKPLLYFGLRGVGKTVLLNKIEEHADKCDVLYAHIEAGEDRHFIDKMISSMNRIIQEISLSSKISHVKDRFISLLRSVKISYSSMTGELDIGFSPDLSEFANSVDFESDFTTAVVELGKTALQTNNTVCFFIDEMQYLSNEEIGAIVAAIHRCNQLRLPVTIFCAGLPKIRKAVGEAKSYAERLFEFHEVSSLLPDDAAKAIRTPASDLGVHYNNDAVEEIISISQGYPYFIQELCDKVWTQTEGSFIKKEDVDNAKQAFFDDLDTGFFSVRYEKCSVMEKAFMAAMVKCGELPCSISNVAAVMERSVKSISPFRARLINKGMIYATGHAEIDFTVPQFDGFIRRKNPNLDISG